MVDRFRILSNDFVVLFYIYEQTEIYKRNICFSQIIKEIDLKQKTVNKSIDRLYDCLMIDAEWKKVEDGNWAYCFSVSENFKGFTKGLYNAVEKANSDEKSKSEEIKNIMMKVEGNKKEKALKKDVELKENKETETSKKENEFK